MILYIKIESLENITALERANQISQELWALTMPRNIRPSDYVTNSLFPIVEDINKDIWLEVEPNYIINVHPQNDITKLTELFPNLDEEDVNKILDCILNKKIFNIREIIPKIFPYQKK